MAHHVLRRPGPARWHWSPTLRTGRVTEREHTTNILAFPFHPLSPVHLQNNLFPAFFTADNRKPTSSRHLPVIIWSSLPTRHKICTKPLSNSNPMVHAYTPLQPNFFSSSQCPTANLLLQRQTRSAEVGEREVPGEQVTEGRVVGHPLHDLARRPATQLAPLHGHPHALRQVALHRVHEPLRRQLHVLGVRLHQLREQQLLLPPHAGRRPDELLLRRLQLVEQPLRSVHPHLRAAKAAGERKGWWWCCIQKKTKEAWLGTASNYGSSSALMQQARFLTWWEIKDS